MKKLLTLFLALFILQPCISKAQQITDANLRNCISAAQGKPFSSLSGRELLEITKLECTEKGIASITGIDNLANLVELNLNDNEIRDISPLARLDGLTKLYLWHNRIEDISPVAGLKHLQELYLWGNEIEDIVPLANLKKLEELLLGDNQIADISPLAGLTNLDQLEIFNNRVTDITPLKGLTRLEILDGSGNSISNISALRKMGLLSRLFLNGNSITDIKPLADLKSLKTLFLGYNRISDISALARLNELRIVDLSNNSITEISALENLANLQRLTLDNNLVIDVSLLIGLPNLNHVGLLNNCIWSSAIIGQVKSVTGMEYQHKLCSSPNLVRKTITMDWLDEQIGRQCVPYGEKDYSLRNEYDYLSDGIYYMYYPRNEKGESREMIVCRLPWKSHFDDFLLLSEKTEETGKKYKIFRYGNNDRVYVQNGMIKGHSEKWLGSLKHKSAIEEIMDIFEASYDIERSTVNGKEILLARKKNHVIREIIGDDSHTVQFFEAGFYAAEIAEQK